MSLSKAFSRSANVLRTGLAALVAVMVLFAAAPRECAASDRFVAVVYHDITPKPAVPDDFTLDEFTKQLAFFRSSGFHPVSVADIVAAAAGKKALPDKALLLTFDDGYLSFYKIVFPILKQFRYPAVLSVVTSWADGRDNPGAYSKEKGFMNWTQIKEVADSGLVTVASHSDGLHTFVHSNPQGNIDPASSTFIYDKGGRFYESEDTSGSGYAPIWRRAFPSSKRSSG